MKPIKIGIIGLGAMGYPIALHLAKRCFMVAYSRHWEVKKRLQNGGVTCADSIEDLAERCETVFLCVRTSEQCQEVISDFPIEGTTCKTIVLLSTVSPADAVLLATLSASKGIRLCALPVSGGVGGAEEGSLSGYYAGPQDLYQAIAGYAKSFCKCIYNLGPRVGCAFELKAVIQFLVAVNIIATSEASRLIAALGINKDVAYEAICESSGSSNIFTTRGADALAQSFQTGRSGISIHLKDLRICESLIEDESGYELIRLCGETFSNASTKTDGEKDAVEIAFL